MSSEGQTAVVVPLPAADPILAEVERTYPGAVRPGVPAHVSVLYPFVPAAEVDEAVLAWLRQFAAASTPLSLRLGVAEHVPGFVSLPVPQLCALVSAVQARWPQILPYGGQFGANPMPHVTAALGLSASEGAQVTGRVRAWLPMEAVADQLWLLSYNGQWSLVEAFPFNQAPQAAPRPGRG